MFKLIGRLTKILTLKCDEASQLMSDSFDRPLVWHERLALRGHLFVCSVCPRLHDQLRLVIRASRRRGAGDPKQKSVDEVMQTSAEPAMQSITDDAKQRLKDLVRSAEKDG